MSMNRICLMGRIGRDLELKKTNSGVSVVSFPLALIATAKRAARTGSTLSHGAARQKCSATTPIRVA